MLQYLTGLFRKMPGDPSSYLIVGLGNPGREYKNNRHNAGFMLLDVLAGRLDAAFTRLESKALVTRSRYGESRIILAKPQTYMNNSGLPVSALLRYYKIPLENLLVTYDDVDLDLGTIRLRPSGSAGGQKGMDSIIKRIGSNEFARLRIGISRPPGRMEAADYVLQDFPRSEKEVLLQVLDHGAQAALSFVSDGIEEAMNLYNGKLV